MQIRIRAAFAASLLLTGAVALFADQGGGSGRSNDSRLKTKLSGAAIEGQKPEGSADFRSEANGRTRLNVEVEHVKLPAGTVLTVSVQDGATITAVGTIKLSAIGESELELNSQDGATVPVIKKGEMVTVSNGGAAILAGVF